MSGTGFCKRSLLAYGLPVLVWACIDLLTPADQLALPRAAVWQRFAASLCYDRGDTAAFALRGLNAQLGRSAGRADIPRHLTPEEFNQALDRDGPLSERYFLEYPHLATCLFRLGWLATRPEDVAAFPAALLDARYDNLGLHLPRNEEERGILRQFVTATRIYRMIFLLCFLGLMRTLQVGFGPDGLSAPPWWLLLPGALFFTFSRFDVVPAVLVALSLACLGRGKMAMSAVFLGLATLAKVYPCLLAPLIVRYLWTRRDSPVQWSMIYLGSLSVGLFPLFTGEDSQGMLGPLRFQLMRPPEFQFTAYGLVLPELLVTASWAGYCRLGSLVLLTGVLMWRPIDDLADLLRRGALLLLYFLSIAVFYSPQWVLWLAPLLLPLAARSRGLLVLFVGLDLASYGVVPCWALLRAILQQQYLAVADGDAVLRLLEFALVYARFLIVGFTVFLLIRMPQRAPAQASVAFQDARAA